MRRHPQQEMMKDIVGAVVEGCNAIAKVIQEHPNEKFKSQKKPAIKKIRVF